MAELSRTKGRVSFMRKFIFEAGSAIGCDVSQCSLNGKTLGRTTPYPPELVEVTKSRRYSHHILLSLRLFFIDFFKYRLSMDTKEMFSFSYSQDEFRSMCPDASSLYDRETNSIDGVPVFEHSLKNLGFILNSAQRL